MIFTTIADDATDSGRRIVTEFEKARKSIEDLNNVQFSFDDKLLSQLETDKNALLELQNKLKAGEAKTEGLIASILTQNASKDAVGFANKADFLDLNVDDFVNDQKKAHIAMLAMDKSLENCASLIDGYNQALKKADGSHQLFIDGVLTSNQQLGNYLTSLGGAEGTVEGYQKSLNNAKVATLGLKVATAALNVALSFLGTVALNYAISKIYELATAQERAREAAEEGATTYNNSKRSIEDYVDQIENLRTKLDNGSLSEVDAYKAKQDLLKIQNDLTQAYGNQAAGIDLLNGKLETELALVRQLTQADANKFLNEDPKGIAKAEKEMTKQRKWYLGEFKNVEGNEDADLLNQIIEKYKDNLETTVGSDGITTTIHFTGDVTQAEEVLNGIMTDIRNAGSVIEDSYDLSDIYTAAAEDLQTTNQILEKYQDIYKAAKDARLVADPDVFAFGEGDDRQQGTAAKWINDYSQAIEDYNNALASGDTSKISEAASKFIAVDTAVQALLQNSGMKEYADQFTEVRNQLNETAIAQREFNQQLKDEDKTIKEHADALKELKMTEAQFLSISIDTSSVEEGTENVRALITAAQEMGLISTNATQAEIENFARSLVNSGVLVSSAIVDTTKNSFSALFKKDDGLSDQISTKLEKIDTLKEAMKSVMSGEFDEASLFALMKEFPDAINHTGNMMEYLKGQIVDIIGVSDDLATEIDESEGIIKILDDAIREAANNPEAVASLMQLKNLVLELAYATAKDFTINIEVEKSSLEALRNAIDEARSATGLTQESVEALRNRYKGLAGFNPLELFESTNTGLYLNNGILADLEEAYSKNKFEKIGDQLAYLKEQLVYADSQAQHDFILDQITDLELLEAQYVGLTSEFNKWTQATASANDRDMFESVAKGKEEVKKLIEQGWTHSDDVTSYLDLLTGDGLIDTLFGKNEDGTSKKIEDLTAKQIQTLYKQLDKNIDKTKYSIFDFFKTDKDGNVTSEGVANFFDAVEQKLKNDPKFKELGESVLQADGSFNFLGDNMKNTADALGISVELMEVLLRAAQEAGSKVEFNSMFTGLDESTAKIDTLKKKLDELGKSYVEIDVYTNKENLASEIEKAKTEYEKALQSGDKDLMEYYGASIDTMVARKNYKDFMGIDTSKLEGDMQKSIDLLQKWQTEKNKAESAGIKGDKDTQFSAEQQITDLAKQLDELVQKNPEIKTKLGFEDGESTQSFLTKLTDGTVSIDIQAILAEANKSDIQMLYEMNGQTLTVNMNVEGNAKEAVEQINALPESKTVSIDAQLTSHFADMLNVISSLNTFKPSIQIDVSSGESVAAVKGDIESIGTGLTPVQITVSLDSNSKSSVDSGIDTIGSSKSPVQIKVELNGDSESAVTASINAIGTNAPAATITVELDAESQNAVQSDINSIGTSAPTATITVTLDPTTQSQVTTDINAIGANAQPANIIVSVNKSQLTQLDSDVSKQRTANVVTIVARGQLNALEGDTEQGYGTNITVNVLRDQFDTLKTEAQTGLDATVRVKLDPEDPLSEIKQYAAHRDSNTNPNGTPKDTGVVTPNPMGSGSSSYGLGSQVQYNGEQRIEESESFTEKVSELLSEFKLVKDALADESSDSDGEINLDYIMSYMSQIISSMFDGSRKIPLDVPDNGIPLDIPEGGIELNIPEGGLPINLNGEVPQNGLTGGGTQAPQTQPVTVDSSGETGLEPVKQDVEELSDTEVEIAIEAEVEGQDDVDLMIESVEILDDHDYEIKADTQGQEELDKMVESHKAITDVSSTVTANVFGVEDLRILKSEISTVKGKEVDVTAKVSGLDEVKALVDAINNLQSKTVEVGAKVTGTATSKATGTAYSQGTTQRSGKAYSHGNWGTKDSGTALMGELGQELLVRGGHFYTVGDHSAEFVNYKKGDIIFNHEQTRQIFEHGRILYGQKRAHAFGGGTAFVTGNAFATAGGASSTASPRPSVSGLTTGSASKNQKSSGKGKGKDKEKEEWFDWIEIAIDRIERAIDDLELKATSAFRTWGERTSNLRQQMSMVTDEIDLQKRAYDRYIQEANNVGLNAHYAKLVREGAIDIELIKDEELIEKIKDYQEFYEKALDCHYAVEELNESLSELYKENFDNVVSQYEGILSVIEHEKSLLEEAINRSEEQGYIVSIEYYQALMEKERKNIEKYSQQRIDMQKALNEAVESGTIAEYSEAWYEMNNEINDVVLSIEEANTALIEYNNSIRDVEWEIFDLLQEKIGYVVEETEFLVDLLSGDKLHEDSGQLTQEGMATMGMHGMAYNTYMEQAKRYAQELKAIEEDIANDPNNQDLLERRQELLEAQRDSILAAQDERKEIVDLVEEGIDLELEALEKRIDKYNESLEFAKELYEYQKKIQESTKEIASLEKQMMAYQGDDSEETKAKIQELKVSLEEARADLEETEYDHFIDDTEKMLDDLYTEYEELLNMRLDDIDVLVSDMIDEINANSGMINDTLQSLSKEFGFELSNILNGTWNGEGTVITVYDEGIMNSIDQASTRLSEELISIDRGIWDMVASLDQMASSNIANMPDNVHGYASGAYRISRNQLAWTQENREMEAIIRPSDGAILTPLMRNDSILNARATSNLFDLVNDPSQFIKDHLDMNSMASIVKPTTTVGNTYDNDFAIQFSLSNVSNYEQFIREMQNDRNFERMIKSMTVDKLFGESNMNKYRF